jgi:phosphoglycolate phosphatase
MSFIIEQQAIGLKSKGTTMDKIKPNFVLFDLDGTLIDSVPDLSFCVDEMMRQVGMPVRGDALVRNWLGNGVRRLVERALVGSDESMPAQELMDRAYPIFLDLYKHNNSLRSTIYDGVVEGLKWMLTQGYRIACVTNKPQIFAIPLLKDKGLYDYFEFVISGDSCTEKKPHPMPLLNAAKRMNFTPESGLMIGDSRSDIKAARSAGLHIFCMTYGYNHGEDIHDYEPDVTLDSFTELANYIETKIG